MLLRRLATNAMYASLIAATGISLAWVLITDDEVLESSAQLLALTAALTGIVAERLAAERQRRQLALIALTDELRKNEDVIGDLRLTLGQTMRRRVYPRLLISAADAVIASGVLTGGGNQELISMLHQWRNEVTDFNRRLDLTEMLTFLQGTPEVIRGFERALGRDDGRLHRVDRLRQDLIELLTETTRDDARPSAASDRPQDGRVRVAGSAAQPAGAGPQAASIPRPTPPADESEARQPAAW
jgi:hypothetical protein